LERIQTFNARFSSGDHWHWIFEIHLSRQSLAFHLELLSGTGSVFNVIGPNTLPDAGSSGAGATQYRVL
jgi:hypothetical protein